MKHIEISVMIKIIIDYQYLSTRSIFARVFWGVFLNCNTVSLTMQPAGRKRFYRITLWIFCRLAVVLSRWFGWYGWREHSAYFPLPPEQKPTALTSKGKGFCVMFRFHGYKIWNLAQENHLIIWKYIGIETKWTFMILSLGNLDV